MPRYPTRRVEAVLSRPGEKAAPSCWPTKAAADGAGGVPVPKSAVARNLDEAVKAAEEIGYPRGHEGRFPGHPP